MAKSPRNFLKSQYTRRTSIRCHVKVKIPKKLQQQSSCKTKATKVNVIMEELDKLDRNRHHRINNINHFSPLYESCISSCGPSQPNLLGWVLKLLSLEMLQPCRCPAWLVWWHINSLPQGCETEQSYSVGSSRSLSSP